MPLQLALESDLDGGAAPVTARAWISLGERAEWRIRAERTSLAGLPRIDLSERLQHHARELRGAYLEWIGELSQLNASVEWWSTELAAKSAYTMLFNRLCSLACILERLEELDGTLVVAATEAQLTEIETAARRAGIATTRLRGRARRAVPWSQLGSRALNAWTALPSSRLRGLPVRLSKRATKLLDGSPRYRRRVVDERHVQRAVAPGGWLFFTWVDQRSFGTDGSYEDAFFGDVPAELERRGIPVVFVPRVLPTMPFADAVAAFARGAAPALFPEGWLSLDDWRDSLRRSREYQPNIPGDATVGGVPAALLAREHVGLYRWAHALSLVYESLVRNLAAAGVRPDRIVHTFEGHPWEQVLTATAREVWPDVRITGYENANMTRLALSMYPARTELDLRPLPNVVVTNGPRFRTILLEEGWPEDRVVTGCAIRHGYLAEAANAALHETGAPLRVIAATDASLGQAVELIEKAIAAFGGDPRYELVLKCHPILDPRDVSDAVPGIGRTNGVTLAQGSLATELAKAQLLLYSYSIVPYEALAHGVPPIFVRAETTLDLDQLEPFPETRWTARTPDELRAVAEEIGALSPAERDAWRSRARAAVTEALAPQHEDCVDAFTR